MRVSPQPHQPEFLIFGCSDPCPFFLSDCTTTKTQPTFAPRDRWQSTTLGTTRKRQNSPFRLKSKLFARNFLKRARSNPRPSCLPLRLMRSLPRSVMAFRPLLPSSLVTFLPAAYFTRALDTNSLCSPYS